MTLMDQSCGQQTCPMIHLLGMPNECMRTYEAAGQEVDRSSYSRDAFISKVKSVLNLQNMLLR